MYDWDAFYFEHWVYEHPNEEPSQADYQDWLFDQADRALWE